MGTDQTKSDTAESIAPLARRRIFRRWLRRQLECWLGSRATPVVEFLAICSEFPRISRMNAQLRNDQAKIKATNAHLQSDQGTLKAFNEYLERERDWLQSRNAQLRADRSSIIGAPEPNIKLKIAPGMLSQMDTEAIIELARKVPADGTIVDIGSLLGMTASLWCIHSSALRIVCIDPWEQETQPGFESFRGANGPVTKEAFLANVPDVRIEAIKGYSPSCAKGWTTPIDLYWEDGDHSNPTCANSIRFWSSHVKPGGIACGHDYHIPDVKAEADALAARWGSKLNLFGSVWWVQNG